MEEINKEEELEEQEDTDTEDTPPEDQEDESEDQEDESEEESEDVDHKKTLEELEGEDKPNKLDKAKRALFFTAKGVEELGGNPREVLGIKEDKDADDVDKKIDRKFKEQEARKLARSDDELKVIMWYVNNQNLSVEDAHILANKSRLKKFASETKRSNVTPPRGGSGSRKPSSDVIPKRSSEEVEILERRGLKFNPKTNTYQGKYTEEYWDGEKWSSRKR